VLDRLLQNYVSAPRSASARASLEFLEDYASSCVGTYAALIRETGTEIRAAVEDLGQFSASIQHYCGGDASVPTRVLLGVEREVRFELLSTEEHGAVIADEYEGDVSRMSGPGDDVGYHENIDALLDAHQHLLKRTRELAAAVEQVQLKIGRCASTSGSHLHSINPRVNVVYGQPEWDGVGHLLGKITTAASVAEQLPVSEVADRIADAEQYARGVLLAVQRVALLNSSWRTPHVFSGDVSLDGANPAAPEYELLIAELEAVHHLVEQAWVSSHDALSSASSAQGIAESRGLLMRAAAHAQQIPALVSRLSHSPAAGPSLRRIQVGELEVPDLTARQHRQLLLVGGLQSVSHAGVSVFGEAGSCVRSAGSCCADVLEILEASAYRAAALRRELGSRKVSAQAAVRTAEAFLQASQIPQMQEAAGHAAAIADSAAAVAQRVMLVARDATNIGNRDAMPFFPCSAPARSIREVARPPPHPIHDEQPLSLSDLPDATGDTGDDIVLAIADRVVQTVEAGTETDADGAGGPVVLASAGGPSPPTTTQSLIDAGRTAQSRLVDIGLSSNPMLQLLCDVSPEDPVLEVRGRKPRGVYYKALGATSAVPERVTSPVHQ